MMTRTCIRSPEYTVPIKIPISRSTLAKNTDLVYQNTNLKKSKPAFSLRSFQNQGFPKHSSCFRRSFHRFRDRSRLVLFSAFKRDITIFSEESVLMGLIDRSSCRFLMFYNRFLLVDSKYLDKNKEVV